HAAIEATGMALPSETVEKGMASDAILLGAVGHPKYDNDPKAKVRPEQGLLGIRKALQLYSNIRPITIFDELIGASSLKPEVLRGADILFFRELTGGIYFGERGRVASGTAAYDTMFYSKSEVSRIIHTAFKSAKTRRGILHSVDKANVLESSRIWRETVQEIAPKYPDVELHHMFVDNAAMQLIRDPKQFDVVVTGNLFGDILTDEASQIAGSLGMLASASVGDHTGIYEPVHGSAPDIAGQDIANPIATILSVALMLDIAGGHSAASQMIVDSVRSFLKTGYRTKELSDKSTDPARILGCTACGDQIVKIIKAEAHSNSTLHV
ncbi:MAG: 3-isopropylmalate dehydrogenase, partial [Bacteroidia bacterium]|nr:3-isopropylmalate dehydrogenase [Bacteroidia bacterium]